MKTEDKFIKYEVRYIAKGFNVIGDVLRTINYREKEEALEMAESLKKKKGISKVSLFKVTEKYEKIDI